MSDLYQMYKFVAVIGSINGHLKLIIFMCVIDNDASVLITFCMLLPWILCKLIIDDFLPLLINNYKSAQFLCESVDILA